MDSSMIRMLFGSLAVVLLALVVVRRRTGASQ